ncbi:unnamed protein product [Closterium sp. Naga37s-1]|nr:unnamed protein product [Closterium sp. Naga37s-1]
MPEGIRKYYVLLLNLILLFLIAWQASPYVTRSYDYRGVTSAGGKGMMTLGKDVPVQSSAATDAKEASLDSSEWSLSDKLVAGRPAAVAGDATGSQERGSGAASDSHGRGQGESGDAGRHREGGAADGGKGSAKAKEKLEHVCYTSSAPWKGYHLVPRNHLPPGVVVGGRGCARCVRGRECGMRVWINAPATWVQIYPNASWWKKDMTLILKGPALSHGDVRCLDPPACSQLDLTYRLWDLTLTYRLWDVGQYRCVPRDGKWWEVVGMGQNGFGMGKSSLVQAATGQSSGCGSYLTPRLLPARPLLPPLGRELALTYRLWDVGQYRRVNLSFDALPSFHSAVRFLSSQGILERRLRQLAVRPQLQAAPEPHPVPPFSTSPHATFSHSSPGIPERRLRQPAGIPERRLRQPAVRPQLQAAPESHLQPLCSVPLTCSSPLSLPRAFLSVGCANLRFGPNYKQHLSLIYSLSVPFPSRVRLLSPFPGHS